MDLDAVNDGLGDVLTEAVGDGAALGDGSAVGDAEAVRDGVVLGTKAAQAVGRQAREHLMNTKARQSLERHTRQCTPPPHPFMESALLTQPLLYTIVSMY